MKNAKTGKPMSLLEYKLKNCKNVAALSKERKLKRLILLDVTDTEDE